jgi:hypothetical protein
MYRSNRESKRMSRIRLFVRTGAILIGVALLSGCGTSTPLAVTSLIQHQAFMDFGGLSEVQTIDSVRVTAAPPANWTPRPLQRSSLYLHQQWKSPSGQTGVGVAHIRSPIPLSSSFLVRFASREYAKRGSDGELLNEWTDEFGRPWFEAQNSDYYVRGFAVTRGFEAWVIYCGYRRSESADVSELSLAMRSLETFLPLSLQR